MSKKAKKVTEETTEKPDAKPVAVVPAKLNAVQYVMAMFKKGAAK